jgi:hypothetical protein
MNDQGDTMFRGGAASAARPIVGEQSEGRRNGKGYVFILPRVDVALAAPVVCETQPPSSVVGEPQPPSLGDEEVDECDLPDFMLQAMKKGRTERGYSSILQKRKIYGFFYQPPNPILAYSSTDPNAVNWVPNELVEILESNAPKAGDIDENGRSDPKKLEAAMHKVFKTVPTFCNMYQLKQFSLCFGEQWGFRVATNGTYQLHCCFASPRKKEYISKVPPSKTRNASTRKCQCPFKIMGNTKIRLPTYSEDPAIPKSVIVVAINFKSSVFLHDFQQCQPGVTSLRIAKRSAGATRRQRLVIPKLVAQNENCNEQKR